MREALLVRKPPPVLTTTTPPPPPPPPPGFQAIAVVLKELFGSTPAPPPPEPPIRNIWRLARVGTVGRSCMAVPGSEGGPKIAVVHSAGRLLAEPPSPSSWS